MQQGNFILRFLACSHITSVSRSGLALDLLHNKLFLEWLNINFIGLLEVLRVVFYRVLRLLSFCCLFIVVYKDHSFN